MCDLLLSGHCGHWASGSMCETGLWLSSSVLMKPVWLSTGASLFCSVLYPWHLCSLACILSSLHPVYHHCSCTFRVFSFNWIILAVVFDVSDLSQATHPIHIVCLHLTVSLVAYPSSAALNTFSGVVCSWTWHSQTTIVQQCQSLTSDIDCLNVFLLSVWQI
jgi:hypothetical protein